MFKAIKLLEGEKKRFKSKAGGVASWSRLNPVFLCVCVCVFMCGYVC